MREIYAQPNFRPTKKFVKRNISKKNKVEYEKKKMSF